MTDPAWLDLEHLTAQIYAELAPDAVVTHNDHIQGGISGTQRQIDISIRTITAGHEFLTIIDTKDQGRPLEIADVDAFSALVEDVRANKGILIGRSGFTEGARQSARARGLDLCRVHDTANRRWSQDVTIPILWRELVPEIDFALEAQLQGNDSVPVIPTDWLISTDATHQRRVLLEATFESAWNSGRIPMDPGSRNVLQPPDAPSWWLQVGTANGLQWRQVVTAAISYTVIERVYLGQLTPDEARGIVHDDGRFVASFVGLTNMPVSRDPSWPLVDPADLSIAVGGTIVTSTSWEVRPGSARYTDVRATLMRDGETIAVVYPDAEASAERAP